LEADIVGAICLALPSVDGVVTPGQRKAPPFTGKRNERKNGQGTLDAGLGEGG